jgi:hypothetical protein
MVFSFSRACIEGFLPSCKSAVLSSKDHIGLYLQYLLPETEFYKIPILKHYYYSDLVRNQVYIYDSWT